MLPSNVMILGFAASNESSTYRVLYRIGFYYTALWCTVLHCIVLHFPVQAFAHLNVSIRSSSIAWLFAVRDRIPASCNKLGDKFSLSAPSEHFSGKIFCNFTITLRGGHIPWAAGTCRQKEQCIDFPSVINGRIYGASVNGLHETNVLSAWMCLGSGKSDCEQSCHAFWSLYVSWNSTSEA